jgi:hypothetical protein
MTLAVFTLDEVAEQFRCSRGAAMRVVNEFPGFFKQIGRRILIAESELRQVSHHFEVAARHGTIYVVGFSDFVKIGYSRDPEGRFAAIASGLPLPLTIYAQIKGPATLERKLHARFGSLRLQGEWFQKDEKLAAWINAGCPL